MLDLVPFNDPILTTPTTPFDFKNPPENPYDLFDHMKETMIAKKGIGLSANQVGKSYSVFVLGEPYEPESIRIMFNPKIVHASEEKVISFEACLSFPGIVVQVKRPETIRVRFAHLDGKVETQIFGGIVSRIIQHETDHLNGITLISGFSRLKMELTLKRAKKKYNQEYNLQEIMKVANAGNTT